MTSSLELLQTAEARAAAFVVPRTTNARKIVVALSGGVDSSVAAWLLKEMGHEVIGVSLRLAPDDDGSRQATSGRCCSVDDMADARRVCGALGIAFHAIDARARFREAVFQPFVDAWRRGETPIPCLACNHEVKVGDLLKTARDLGATLATGHYARKVQRSFARGERWALARPVDDDRDQTYYLYGTPHEDIADLELPLGDLDKPVVRALAKRAGLAIFHKPDSQEICFVPDGDTAGVVERAGGKGTAGELVHIDGRHLRTHDGVHRFTVGQRRGTGVSSSTPGERLYVLDVDGSSGAVTVGQREHLAVTRVQARPLRLAQPVEAWPAVIDVQVRARAKPQRARFTADVAAGTLALAFEESVYGIALGQAAVCYDGDTLLGGALLTARVDGAAPRAVASCTGADRSACGR
jgi:tRNA-specific 2-thiouridylase